MGQNPNPKGLIIGNYCHDILIKDNLVLAQTLGGAVSFISAVLHGLTISADYISKVGPDFIYNDTVNNHTPIVSQSGKTTVFEAYFLSDDPSVIRREDRVLKRVESCDPINVSDLPDEKVYDFGMAVGIAGEVIPETLEKLLDICNVVFVDIQSLIRVFDETNGTVKHVGLKQSGFYHLVHRIGFLKASAEEAPFMDVEEVRKLCCVVVTSGKDGCSLYWKDGEMQIDPFSTVQVDPTGAGDSFLAGLVAGLVEGLAIPDAALLGNFFGSLTVGQIGLPEFDERLMQKVKNEIHKRKTECNGNDDDSRFTKPRGHEQFIASLQSAKLTTTRTISPRVADQVLDPDSGYTHHQMLFFKKSVYEEPIKSIDANP
ncbi:inositol 3-kinase-like [Rutidosis leptorrhynchoides]|uniref:inositol 3-kinase-like n=1 Tax=Rutidosis leptorrhynchoides TaxID=125765 RepID=UPI003A994A8B